MIQLKKMRYRVGIVANAPHLHHHYNHLHKVQEILVHPKVQVTGETFPLEGLISCLHCQHSKLGLDHHLQRSTAGVIDIVHQGVTKIQVCFVLL